jgi:hypothetical protein
MKRFTTVIVAISCTLALVSCGGSSNSATSSCSEIQPIAAELAATLGKIATDFSSSENASLATSLAKLRKLNFSDPAISTPLNLLEDSVQSLMSNLLASDSVAASEDVNNMSTAVQSLTAACGL